MKFKKSNILLISLISIFLLLSMSAVSAADIADNAGSDLAADIDGVWDIDNDDVNHANGLSQADNNIISDDPELYGDEGDGEINDDDPIPIETTIESNDENFSFKTVKEWYDYQNDFINNFDLMNYDNIIYRDKVKLSKVIVYKKKQKIAKCDLIMYKDRYEFVSKKKQIVLKFDDVYATSVLGKNKFNVYIGDDVYQIKADKRFNAVKYVNIYYRYKNIKENNNEQFLGL